MYMYYMVYFLFFTGDIHTNNNAFIDFLEWFLIYEKFEHPLQFSTLLSGYFHIVCNGESP